MRRRRRRSGRFGSLILILSLVHAGALTDEEGRDLFMALLSPWIRS